LVYSVGEGCCGVCCLFALSCVFSRDEDFVAPKFEKMFFESLRGFGEAGDSGMLWNGAFGEWNSGMLGDRGLCGLIGALLFSFPPDFDRMASDSVDDFGILRTCLRGLPWCYCPLSVALHKSDTARGSVVRGRSTSTEGHSSGMALNWRPAGVRSRERSVAGGWGAAGLSEYDTWVAAVAEKRLRGVALSTRLCLLPIVSASAEHAKGSWQGAAG
jgi:hypothetical protein